MVKIKKIVLFIFGILLVSGCTRVSGDLLKDFKDYNEKHESYNLKGILSIISGEDEYKYDINVYSKDNEYYKVSLINKDNDHEQVILKNDDGVYVITPELNKSFKFQSNWPNNSSQTYIISSLIKDVTSSTKASIKKNEDGYIITTSVNYPNNDSLDHEKIYTDKKFNIKRVEILNKEDKVEVTLDIKDLVYKDKSNNDTFKLESYVKDIKEEEDCLSECEDDECKDKCTSKETIKSLDDIIYPLYVPDNTYLSGKDIIDTDNGNRVILTFEGDSPFILVEEAAHVNDEMDVVPVNGEILFLSNGLGAISDNGVYWNNLGIDYYLTSKSLAKDEMKVIAESIQNNTNLVAYTK